jgi:hypothetical protein
LDELIHLVAAFALDGRPEIKGILRRKIFDFRQPDAFEFFDDLPAEVFEVDGLVEIAGQIQRTEAHRPASPSDNIPPSLLDFPCSRFNTSGFSRRAFSRFF